MNYSRPIPSREERVWNYRAIARGFVVNLEPMPREVQTEELMHLVKLIRHKAELDLLQKLNLQEHALAKEASAHIAAARAEITFHNHALLEEEDISF